MSRNRYDNSRHSTALAVAALVAFICLMLLGLVPEKAHAEGAGKTGGRQANVTMTFSLQDGLGKTETDLILEKGPVVCSRCGEIAMKYDLAGRLHSVRVKRAYGENVLSASYYYYANDGSGAFDGKNKWNHHGSLPATEWKTDVQGNSHELFLTSVSVLAYDRRAYERRSNQTKHVGGTV